MSLMENVQKFNQEFLAKVRDFNMKCSIVISEERYVLDNSGLHPGDEPCPDLVLTMTETSFQKIVHDPRSILGLVATRKIQASPPSIAIQVAKKLSVLA